MRKKRGKGAFLYVLLLVLCTTSIVVFLAINKKADLNDLTENESEISDVLEEEPVESGYYAVMIDNLGSARPQYGTSMAAITYEMLAEGGITRYLAIFDRADIEKIGPVRSARPYFIEKANEFGLMLVHCGGSPDAYTMLGSGKYPHLDEIANSSRFFRDKKRKAPHNLFVSSESIMEYATKKDYEAKQAENWFNFQKKETKPATDYEKGIWQCSYPNNYRVTWEYSYNENLYYRYINGKLQVDEGNDKAVSVSNIIVQYETFSVSDSVGRLEVSQAKNGNAVLIKSGTHVECTWEITRAGWTKYYTTDGVEIELNPGKTFVQVLSSQKDLQYLEQS